MPVSVVIGGQFGSEGKGKVALEIARYRSDQRLLPRLIPAPPRPYKPSAGQPLPHWTSLLSGCSASSILTASPL